MIPSPLGLSFSEWSNSVVEEYSDLGIKRWEGEDWRMWAERLMELDAFAGHPRHDAFSDWRTWAEAFVGL